jgi:hypothetical protein
MSAPDFTGACWRKSSRSNGEANCVEIAWSGPAVGARDSKLGEGSPILAFSQPAWASFVTTVKSGESELS